jgi:hypothetical protein
MMRRSIQPKRPKRMMVPATTSVKNDGGHDEENNQIEFTNINNVE